MKLLPLKKNKKKIFLSLLFVSSLVIPFSTLYKPVGTDAQDNSAIWSQISQLQNQMANLNSSIQKEQSQISSLNGQINENAATISQTQAVIDQKQEVINEQQSQINLLAQSISQEQSQVDALNTKINQSYAVFVQRAKESYEDSYLNPLLITLGNNSIDNVFANLEYFTDTRKQDSALISDMKNNQFLLQQKLDELNVQQNDLTNAQNQLISEKNDLQSQENSLENRIAIYNSQKTQLNSQIHSNQVQLAQIAQQATSLKDAIVGSGSGPVYGAPGWDYWYFNQEDPRWKTVCIGGARYYYGANCYGDGTSIGEIGCLVTDAAMIAAYYGQNVNPGQLASIQSYFEGVYWAWPSMGMNITWLGGLSDVDNQIAQGHPVIAELYSGRFGTHWIIFIHKQGNDYVINDPYQGGGVMFSNYYSRSQLTGNFVMYAP